MTEPVSRHGSPRNPPPATAADGAGFRPRRAGLPLTALLALALAGCVAAPAPRDDDAPAASTEAGERATQPATAEPPEDAAAAEERGEEPRAETGAEPRLEVALLAPGDAGDAIGQRKSRLARREALRLSRAEAGYYMDVQEAQLRQELHGRGTGIFRQGDSIVLRISGTSAFDTGSARLNPDVEPMLATIAAVLTEYRKTLVVVNSHTDAAGDAGLNQELSEARALAIARHLIERRLAPERIVAVGHGESKPVEESGAPAAGWPDRRIEIELQLIVDESA